MREHETKLSLKQERLAYRRAVQKSLEVFFDKNSDESEEIVTRWWRELEHDPIFRTGFFMHDEPLNAAGDLAGVKTIPPIKEIKEQYERVIREALPKTRKSRKSVAPSVQHLSDAA